MQSIRILALVALAGLLLPCLNLSAGDVASEINGLRVVPSDGKVRIEISKAGDIEFKAFRMSEPDRIVIDCVGAKYDLSGIDNGSQNALVNRVRSSQYQTDPVFISRIVVDLKQQVDYRMFDEGNIHVVELTGASKAEILDSKAGSEPVVPVAASLETDPAKATEMLRSISVASMGSVLPMISPAANKQQPVSDTAFAARTEPQDASAQMKQPVEKDQPDQAAQKEQIKQTYQVEQAESDSPWLQHDAQVNTDDVDRFASLQQETASAYKAPAAASAANASWPESYVRGAPAGGGGAAMGSRKFTLDAQGADIKTVLRTIADFAGVNIVAGRDVKGEIDVHIKDCPWQEAMDIILKAHGFGYREEYGMIRVAELNTLLKEELDVQTAEKKKEELEPLVTRIILINNSNAKELKTALENMLTSQRATIDVDEGSNSLIVRDIERNVEKISEMVLSLDKRTFQVDINAKLVEVDVEASQELGINWGIMNLHKAGFGGVGSVEVDGSVSSSIGTLKYGMVRSWGELNAMLQMLEKSNKANIISNPRITTVDNREASILVGKEIPLIVADEAGNPVTELTKIGIMLRVIPHVNADRTITLDLHPEVSELQSESTAQGGVIISTAEADTRVIVNDGETAVIGGLIKKSDTYVIRGVPFLKDVPFLGRLFSSKSKTDKKTELVIFVTPTIVE